MKIRRRVGLAAATSIAAAIAVGASMAPAGAVGGTFDASTATPTLTEGTGGITTYAFTVSYSGVGAGQVNYATLPGNATEGVDYTAAAGTLQFDGSGSKTVSVPVATDAFAEPNETFSLVLSNPSGGDSLGTNANATIVNDDGPVPVLTVGDISVNEGAGSATFTLNLSPTVGQAVTVDASVVPGSATSADFTPAAAATTIAANQSSTTVVVPINDDPLDESAESFSLNLSNLRNARFTSGAATTSAQATIVDNDAAPALSIANAAVAEGQSGTSTMNLTVSLGAASGQPVAVDVATGAAGDTAAAGSDYTAINRTVTIPAGQTSASTAVTVIGDTVDEDDETFTATLANPVNATLGDATGTGTITDDDADSNFSINDVTVTEGNTGTTTNATLTVTLSPATGRQTTVKYTTVDGTATQPSDYTTTSGTLTFAAGETSKTVTVPITGDNLDENASEALTVTLSDATKAGISDPTGVITITDDDNAPTIAVDDPAGVVEGQIGDANKTVVFTVTLSSPSGTTVTAVANTANAPGANDAVAGDDFNPITNQTITFAPGTTTVEVPVTVFPDNQAEGNEVFALQLSNAVRATFADASGIATIVDDDAMPTVTIGDVSQTEGTGTGTANFAFPVSLSADAAVTTTVAYTTMAGTAGATGDSAGVDFTTTTGTLSFEAGQRTKNILVPVTRDAFAEAPETFTVVLSAPTNASIADDTAVGTILNDDGAPRLLSIDDVTVTEGTGGSATATFTVSLNGPAAQTVVVQATTADGSAVAPGDYTATATTVTFPAGTLTRTVAVPVATDALDEPNETFTVGLAGAKNAGIADGSGTGTISDDEATPALSIDDVIQAEGHAGTSTATFTLRLSGPSSVDQSVTVQTAGGTATAGTDYTAVPTTVVTIPAGTSTVPIAVTIVGDALYEGDESFSLVASGPSAGMTIADGSATGTIDDDESAPTLAIGDASITEGETTTELTFTVTQNGLSAFATTVQAATADGGAVSPADFTATTGTLTIPAGSTSATFTVTVAGDVIDEDDETFAVTLSAPANATIGDGAALGTIVDDDQATLSLDGGTTVAEGDSGTTPAGFGISLSTPSENAVTVRFRTVDATAAAPADYEAVDTTLTIPAGSLTMSTTVNVKGDLLFEDDEQFTVELTNPSGGAVLGTATAVAGITNDDAASPPSTLTIADVTKVEGDANSPVTLTITSSAPQGGPTSVDVTTIAGTATAADFTPVTTTATIAPGATSTTVAVPVIGDDQPEANEAFTVALANAVGNATIADGSATVSLRDDDAQGTYVPVKTTKVYDTREGSNPAKIGAGQTRTVTIAGRAGVPTTGVSAVVLNVTAIAPTTAGSLTVTPAGGSAPASLSFKANQAIGNQVTVPLGTGGAVRVTNKTGQVHVTVEVAGFYRDATVTTVGGHTVPVTPTRLVDTRSGLGGRTTKLGAGQTMVVDVTKDPVPATGVRAVVLSVTAINATATSHLTLTPSGGNALTSVSFPANVARTNLVTVLTSADGNIRVFNKNGATDVLIDVVGYTANPGAVTASTLRALSPTRIYDTATGLGGRTTKVGANETVVVPVTGQGGVPASGVRAVVLNVTASAGTAVSSFTVSPAGGTATTSVSFGANEVVTTQVVVMVPADGAIRIANRAGQAHLAIDVVGAYTAN